MAQKRRTPTSAGADIASEFEGSFSGDYDHEVDRYVPPDANGSSAGRDSTSSDSLPALASRLEKSSDPEFRLVGAAARKAALRQGAILKIIKEQVRQEVAEHQKLQQEYEDAAGDGSYGYESGYAEVEKTPIPRRKLKMGGQRKQQPTLDPEEPCSEFLQEYGGEKMTRLRLRKMVPHSWESVAKPFLFVLWWLAQCKYDQSSLALDTNGCPVGALAEAVIYKSTLDYGPQTALEKAKDANGHWRLTCLYPLVQQMYKIITWIAGRGFYPGDLKNMNEDLLTRLAAEFRLLYESPFKAAWGPVLKRWEEKSYGARFLSELPSGAQQELMTGDMVGTMAEVKKNRVRNVVNSSSGPKPSVKKKKKRGLVRAVGHKAKRAPRRNPKRRS